MSTTDHGGERGRPSLGIDAVPLERFADIEAENGERLLYDRDEEIAWVQSDLYVRRSAMV